MEEDKDLKNTPMVDVVVGYENLYYIDKKTCDGHDCSFMISDYISEKYIGIALMTIQISNALNHAINSNTLITPKSRLEFPRWSIILVKYTKVFAVTSLLLTN
eukprot:TRINITY_DN870_c1_g1_i5.p1 TRINITY_DN870_c1_g1~~TRINITY_DN870_c1_g1_i5.p1  ORF type:complete len:103 (+),score=7.12 TRINITY_DN870_c1_g1_i5:66-374(+)